MPTFKYKNASGTESSITLYTEKITTPSFVVRYNDTDYYASVVKAADSESSKVKFQWAGSIYYVQASRTEKTFTYLVTSSGTKTNTVREIMSTATHVGTRGLGRSVKITNIVVVGGGAGGGGGGGSAYNQRYGASATGASGSPGSHYSLDCSLTVNSNSSIKIVVGKGGSGGSGGSPNGYDKYNGTKISGSYGTDGSAGGYTYVQVPATEYKAMVYALGGSGGGGGEAGYVVNYLYSDGLASPANVKKCSAPSTSGYNNKGIGNNMILNGVSASTAETKKY